MKKNNDSSIGNSKKEASSTAADENSIGFINNPISSSHDEHRNTSINEPYKALDEIMQKENELEDFVPGQDSSSQSAKDSSLKKEESISDEPENSSSAILSSKMNFIYLDSNVVLDYHPLLNAVPRNKKEEMDALWDDISQRMTILVPIIIGNGSLLDGRDRYEMGRKLGIPIPYEERDVPEIEIPGFIDSIHYHHGSDTKSQRACIAFENRERFFKSEDIENIKKLLKGKEKKEEKHNAFRLAGRYYAVSAGLISMAGKIDDKDKTLFDKVKAGLFNLSEANKFLSYKEKHPEIYEEIMNGKVLPSDIKKHLSIASKDKNVYALYKDGKLDESQALDLIELQDYDAILYADILDEKLPFSQIHETLLAAKHSFHKADEKSDKSLEAHEDNSEQTKLTETESFEEPVQESESDISDSVKEMNKVIGENYLKTDAKLSVAASDKKKISERDSDDEEDEQELKLSPLVRERLIFIARQARQSVNDLLTDLLDNYEISKGQNHE